LGEKYLAFVEIYRNYRYPWLVTYAGFFANSRPPSSAEEARKLSREIAVHMSLAAAATALAHNY
jgi:hypothetical protein